MTVPYAGIHAYRASDPGYNLLQFNMRDPQIGGGAPTQVALRRAISMAIDDEAWLRTFEQGVGVVRQHIIGPGSLGFDPAYRNPNAHNPGNGKRAARSDGIQARSRRLATMARRQARSNCG